MFDEAFFRHEELKKKRHVIWAARPNPWNDHCYTLKIYYTGSKSMGSVLTYFYDEGHGKTLKEVVEEYTAEVKAKGAFDD